MKCSAFDELNRSCPPSLRMQRKLFGRAFPFLRTIYKCTRARTLFFSPDQDLFRSTNETHHTSLRRALHACRLFSQSLAGVCGLCALSLGLFGDQLGHLRPGVRPTRHVAGDQGDAFLRHFSHSLHQCALCPVDAAAPALQRAGGLATGLQMALCADQQLVCGGQYGRCGLFSIHRPPHHLDRFRRIRP